MDNIKLQQIIINTLENIKAKDIKIFNTLKFSSLFDSIIIASSTSNKHAQAIAISIKTTVKKTGIDVIGIEGFKLGEWILVDCNYIIVHIFQPISRSYYSLENLLELM